MNKVNKIVLGVISTFILALSILAIIYSGPIMCYFVQFTDFTCIESDIYVQPGMDEGEKANLLRNIEISKKRVEDLFGEVAATPVIIVGTDNDKLKKFGMPVNKKSGQTFKTLYKTFIILAANGLNVDVIAHELTHAELVSRVGWIRGLKVPIWFDDGLATQVDYRPQYSEEVWKEKTENGKKVPELKQIETNKQFYADNFNYTIAKHEVKMWLDRVGKKGLDEIITKIKSGEDFYESYKSLESK